MDGVAPDLLDFYSRRYDEDARLRATPHGRLELARTRELLERFLPPPPARVLDVGGGTGIHRSGSLSTSRARRRSTPSGRRSWRRSWRRAGTTAATPSPPPTSIRRTSCDKEAEEAGLAGVEVHGGEGPRWPTLDAHGTERIDETQPPPILAARLVERDPALMAASAHLLAAGRA